MRVAVTGATGLIGSALCARLGGDEVQIVALTRGAKSLPAGANVVRWNPARGELDVGSLEGLDAVVHLAGETVAGRWTARKKEAIRTSREKGTRLLVDSLGRLSKPPAAFVCASAIGIYGDRGDEEVVESSPPGVGFLADVAQMWEKEAARASELGIRTVSTRIGIVLSTRGGALGQMLIPFKLGLGGPVGSGRQWMSWVHIDDVVGAIRFAIERDTVRGPVNVTAPQPVRNADFGKSLGRALHRPAVLPAPAFAIKLLLGEMGEDLLLGGQKVIPRALQEAGYRFQHSEIEGALRDLLASRR